MREYLLIWRALPKLAIGIVFIFELLLLTMGSSQLDGNLRLGYRWLLAHFSGATLLVSLILIIGIVAALGLFLLQVLSALGRTWFKLLLRIVPSISPLRSFSFRELFRSPYEIALRIFQDRGDFYLTNYELKSATTGTEALEKSALIKDIFSDVKVHMGSARAEDLGPLNFYAMLGQDRRTYEMLEDEIELLENIVTISWLGIPVLAVLGIGTGKIMLAATGLLLVSIVLLPEIVRRRRFLASFILAGYLDTFTVHEGAEVADREGEAFM